MGLFRFFRLFLMAVFSIVLAGTGIGISKPDDDGIPRY